MSIKVVSVDASIGAGKTTLITELMKREIPGVKLLLASEPVDLWMKTKVGDDDILTAFYKNKRDIALPFQLIALLTRKIKFDEIMKEAKSIASETGDKVIIVTERTIHSDRHIFAKMLHDSGDINDAGIVAYNMWNDYYVKDSPVDKTVYINVSPIVCHERISKRARNGESVIPIEYLEDCQKAHDDFYENVISKTDCIVVDTTNIPKETDSYTKLIDDVVSFITI